MEDGSSSSKTSVVLDAYINRLILNGISTVGEFSHLLPNPEIKQALAEAAELNPLKGEEPTGGQG